MRTLRGFVLILVSVVLLGSCAQESGPPDLESIPSATIPSGWISYTDETASFQLSYPSDWVQLEIDGAAVLELLEPLAEGTDIDLEASTIVFGVGLPDATGLFFDPNTNIAIESLPFEMTGVQYGEASQQGAQQVFATWETTSQSKASVDGREVAIAHSSMAMSELDPAVTDGSRWWTVQLYAADGKVGWAVSCGSFGLSASDVEEVLGVCEGVVRSFRLITP